jgi:Domain of unknown function (DUF5916)
MLGLSLAATMVTNAPQTAALQPSVESAPRVPAGTPREIQPPVESPAPVSAGTPRESERPPPGSTRVLRVPQTAVRPTVDGALDDAAWTGAAVADRFWISEQERWPGEQTEVLITADREYLYFGFRVYDSQPRAIHAWQTRRGAGLGLDDQVAVELDPFLSYRDIFSFRVNATGVQDDAVTSGRARQLEWKGDWQAAAIRTSYGWSAEIAIPFSILNFEPGTTALGVNFLRHHYRTGEWSRWADITVRALPEEMGRLVGLELPQVGRAQPWTLMPYVLAGRNIPDKRGNVRETLVNAGAELRYQPRPNLTGVLSLNPDFSQVEAALADINFSYNEKFISDLRPFFQEGSAYFGNRPDYFYSNRIPDFDYGAKFFSRAGGYQLGALATRGPQERSDYVVRAEREFDAAHSVGGMVVGSEQPDLRNWLYVVRGQGRERSGLNYAFDAAATSTELRGDAFDASVAGTELQPGDGSRLAGTLGWTQDFWSVAVTADRYTLNYRPLNALLPNDLPDTSGSYSSVNYYRDLGEGPIREVKGNISLAYRQTGDGRLQRRTWNAGGTVESRAQVRFGLWYTAGPYRPVGATPGSWSDTVNDDYYWTASLDLNTRSSRLGYGASLSSGELGGGEYDYLIAYAWIRPTAVTFLSVSSERLSNFGDFDQTIVVARWDISKRQSIAGRYVTADSGEAYRLAYALNLRKNLDFFLVYDREPVQLATLSAKILLTIQ